MGGCDGRCSRSCRMNCERVFALNISARHFARDAIIAHMRAPAEARLSAGGMISRTRSSSAARARELFEEVGQRRRELRRRADA